MSRSPQKQGPGRPPIPAKRRLTVAVQTNVTHEVGRMMRDKREQLGVSESAYLRDLIHRDLGITPNKDRS